jgi:hypothetical protein
MKKITLLLTFFLAIATGSYGQAGSYGFSQSTEVYTAVVGTTASTALGDDESQNNIALPFTFVFEGIAYNNFGVNSNGWLKLGTVAIGGSSWTNNLSNNATTQRPALAIFWDDNNTGTGTIVYAVTGTAPNRIFEVGWNNVNIGGSGSTSATSLASFKLRLYETTNIIEYVYGPTMASAGTLTSSIGLNGTATFLSVSPGVTATTSSSTANNAIASTADIVGKKYIFTPPNNCTGTPLAGTLLPVNQKACAGLVPVNNIVASGFSTGATGITFQWEESDDNGVTDAWANVVGGTGATTSTFTPGLYGGTTIYYRLKVTCTSSGLSAFSTVSKIEPAAAPIKQVSAVTFTNVASTSLTVNWTNGDGGRRVVVVSTTPTFINPSDGQVDPFADANFLTATDGLVYDGNGSSVNVTGLPCNSPIYVKVFEYLRCGPIAGPFDYFFNVSGAANNPNNTTTPNTVVATLPSNVNFTGYTGSNLTTVFPGWKEGVGASLPNNNDAAWTNSTVFGVSNTTAKINLYTNTRNEWIISPKVTITAASRIKFKAAITDYLSATPDPTGMQGTDDKVQVLIATDGCGNTWTSLYTFESSNTITLTNVLTDFTIAIPPSYIGQNVMIAFKGSDGPITNTLPTTPSPTAIDYDFHIGNVKIEVVPTCFYPTALTANSVTTTSASLAWTAGGSETTWNVQYGVTGFVLGSGTIVNGVANPYPVSGLTSNTAYQYYVQANCSATLSSQWEGPYSFSTSCSASAVPYTENFESAIVPAIPNCTAVVNAGNGNTWKVSNNPSSNFINKTLEYSYSFLNAADTWFFTRGVNLVAGTSYRIAYDYGNDSDFYTEKLIVAYGTNPNVASMTNSIADYPTLDTGVKQSATTDFIPTTSGIYYFGFRAYSTANQSSLYVDNISVNLTPSCLAPTALTAVIPTNTSANLSWTSAVANFEVVVQAAGGAIPAVANNTGVNVSGTTYTPTGLTPATAYEYYVRAECILGTDFSTWTGPFAFNTTVISGCASLTSPADNATQVSIATGTIVLSWLAPITGDPATSYDVFTGATAGTVTTLLGNYTTTNAYFPISAINTTVYWKVVPKNISGSAIGCAIRSFTTQSTPPPPPVNDDCSGAIALVTGGVFATNAVIGLTVSATTVPAPTPTYTCQPSRTNDVWYSVTVPASGNITIETDGVTGSGMLDSVMSVFSGSCGSLTQVGCDDDSGNGNFSRVSLTGRTAGETLYVGVWKYLSTSSPVPDGQFKISAYDASLSTTSFDSKGFAAYPNPVTDILNISYTQQISRVSIHNLLGQEVLTKTVNATESKIDMSNLPNGTYLVKVTVDGLDKVLKVLKQ